MRIEGIVATTAMASQNLAEAPQRAERQAEAQVRQVYAPAQQQASDEQASGQRILPEAVKQLEQIVQTFDRSLKFRIHEDTHAIMVQVFNAETDEVIREFPPERILDMVAMFQKQLAGLFVDELK